jgi:hypothetical protein
MKLNIKPIAIYDYFNPNNNQRLNTRGYIYFIEATSWHEAFIKMIVTPNPEAEFIEYKIEEEYILSDIRILYIFEFQTKQDAIDKSKYYSYKCRKYIYEPEETPAFDFDYYYLYTEYEEYSQCFNHLILDFLENDIKKYSRGEKR